jgi:Zn-dependent M28 family amino/carboxypeptidase
MRTVSVTFTAAIAGLLVTSTIAAPANAGRETSALELTRGFRTGVTLAGINEHLNALQAIGTANGGTRVSGTPGFDQSKDYVVDRLEAAGYDVTVQPFPFLFNDDRTPPVLRRISPGPVSFVNGVDFSSMTYSGSGDATSGLTVVDYVSGNSGCESADFVGFPAGDIALVKRGSCPFAMKAQNAQAAGAAGVVVANNTAGLLNGTLGGPVVTIPVVGSTTATGDNLAAGFTNGPTGSTVQLRTDRIAETRTTYNVIAETPGGDADNVVVVGAHLDSVSKGPGINDNSSGSATILEVAETYAAQKRTPTSKLRFIWWGAEESGLLGSNHYVNNLSQVERGKIALNLNFDMIGSPNYVRFVYDGDNSAFPTGPGAAPGPEGSAAIESVFHDYFAGAGLASAETPFSGRSDYGPFIAVGIPAGGLFTGAEGTKTAEQAAIFGGTAGLAYDACYHLGCDTFANVNQTGLDQMSDAVAHAVLTYSRRDFVKSPLVDPVAASAGSASGGEGGGLHAEHEEDAS